MIWGKNNQILALLSVSLVFTVSVSAEELVAPAEPIAKTPDEICSSLASEAGSTHHYVDILKIQCEARADNKKAEKKLKEQKTYHLIAGGVCMAECFMKLTKGMACAGATGFAFMKSESDSKDIKRSNPDTSHVGVEEQAFLDQLNLEIQLTELLEEKEIEAFPVTLMTAKFLDKKGGNWGINTFSSVKTAYLPEKLRNKVSTQSIMASNHLSVSNDKLACGGGGCKKKKGKQNDGPLGGIQKIMDKLNVPACIAGATNIVVAIQKGKASDKAKEYKNKSESEIARLYNAADPSNGTLMIAKSDSPAGSGIVDEGSTPAGAPKVVIIDHSQHKNKNDNDHDEEQLEYPKDLAAAFADATGVSVEEFSQVALHSETSTEDLIHASLKKSAPDQASSLTQEYVALSNQLSEDQMIKPEQVALNADGKFELKLENQEKKFIPRLKDKLASFFNDNPSEEKKADRQVASDQAPVGVSGPILFQGVSARYKSKLKDNALSHLPWANPYNQESQR